MIYIDTPGEIPADHPTAPRCFLGQKHSHLMADTEDELKAYAKKLGMRPSWIQKVGTPYVHFDLTRGFLEKALRDVANDVIQMITPREMAMLILRRKHGTSQNQTEAGGGCG